MDKTNEQLLTVLLLVVAVYIGAIIIVTLYRVSLLISFELHCWRVDRYFKKEAVKREERQEFINLYLSKLDGGSQSRSISLKLDEFNVVSIYDLDPKDWREMRTFLETLKS